VVLERTVRELQGEACIDFETTPPPKQQIISSRSFGAPLYTLQDLAEPIRFHMGRAAEKLRRQAGSACAVGVWLETNRFRPQDVQHSPSSTCKMPEPSDDSAVLTAWAMSILKAIYRPGHRYVKAGVMLLDIRERRVAQGSLFDALPPEHDLRRETLMRVLDKANGKWGRSTMGIGSAGIKGDRAWTMQRANLSPAYSTSWRDLREVT
jgi:DNA polymerase V